MIDEEGELLEGQSERVSPRDDHIVDLGVVADVLDHALIVARDGVPSAALHRGPLPRAEPAVARADRADKEQDAVGIAMHDALARAVAIIADGIGRFDRLRLKLRRIGYELARDRIVRIGGIDECAELRCKRHRVARCDLLQRRERGGGCQSGRDQIGGGACCPGHIRGP